MAIPSKPRKCRICKRDFQPVRPLQNVCSVECAQAKAKVDRAKAERVAEQVSRKVVRMKLEQLQTPHQRRSMLVQKAEKAVRDYRRIYLLLNGYGCISCGRSQQEVIGSEGWKPGGAFDAGHYHSKGARPGLRLTPDNIWLQCKSCNSGSSKYARKASTVAKQYRENLIKEIGIERVEALDADDESRHWTEEELIETIRIYRLKTKELKRVKNP